MIKTGTRLQCGYTLLEAVVYTAVVALLFVIVVNTLLAVVSLYNEFDVYRDLQDSAVTASERITREIRNANQVSTSGSTFGTHPGELVLSSTNESGDPITLEFRLSGDVLHLYKDGVDQGPLTSTEVAVSELVFRHSVATTSELIRLDLELTGEEGAADLIRSFHVSTVLRGSYDQ